MSVLPALKFDGDKPRLDLVPWDAVLEASKVMTYGAAKYDDRNYYGLAQSRLYGATLRHLTAWWNGEDTDPETGLSHLAHAMCGTLMLLEKEIHALGPDDRPWSVGDSESTSDRVADATSAPQESAGIGGKWARRSTSMVDPEQECADVADARRQA